MPKAKTPPKPAAKAKVTPAKSAAAKKLVTKKAPVKKPTPAKKADSKSSKGKTAVRNARDESKWYLAWYIVSRVCRWSHSGEPCMTTVLL